MKTAADAGQAGRAGRRKLGLCVLCGLPAAGKSTFARALGRRLRRERGWAVGVVPYDDVLPGALPDGACARPPPFQWKMLRQELLKYLECFLMAVISGGHISAPSNRTEAMWEDFITCLRKQDLIFDVALEAQSVYLLAKTAASRPMVLVLDDNFYYQSMRYEVYQLARKCSLGFCQLFLDCPLETCLQRNSQRPQALPNETIYLMERKIEKPNPEKNAWEHNSLIIPSPACSLEASLEVTDLLLTSLENPVKYVEDNDNMEQKETDRIVCSTNILHKADQTLRRTISQTMKEAKDVRESVGNNILVRRQVNALKKRKVGKILPLTNGLLSKTFTRGPKTEVATSVEKNNYEQILPGNLKRLAEELNKLKAEFLEDIRQGNKKYLCFQQTIDISDVLSSFL